MAAKHDAKKARANFWVMQQNLAKQKGGRRGYQFSERQPARPVNPVGIVITLAPTPSDEPKPDAASDE